MTSKEQNPTNCRLCGSLSNDKMLNLFDTYFYNQAELESGNDAGTIYQLLESLSIFLKVEVNIILIFLNNYLPFYINIINTYF